jgi:hypothetical protein
MKRYHPYLLSQYWYIVSQRTKWKDFTANAVEQAASGTLDKYILNSWILPHTLIGPCGGFYSTLYHVIEHMFDLAEDIENGMDWLNDDVVLPHFEFR